MSIIFFFTEKNFLFTVCEEGCQLLVYFSLIIHSMSDMTKLLGK